MADITFDGINRIITVNNSVTVLDAQTLYSWWKQWSIIGNNSKYLQAFRPVGGDDIGGGALTPMYFFLLNGWKIRPYDADHVLTVSYNIYVDGGGNPYMTTLGVHQVLVQSKVSDTPVFQLVGGSVLTNEEHNQLMALPDSVVNFDMTGYETHATFGGIQVKDAYLGVIEININSGFSGDVFPVGMPQKPVNNIPDALSLMEKYHISVLKINDDLDVPESANLNGITFISGNTIDRTITLPDTCKTKGTKFNGVILNGTLNGRVEIDDCVIEEVFGFYGSISESAIESGLTIDGSTGQTSHIHHCFALGSNVDQPYLDIDGGKVHVVGWVGWLELRGKTSSDVFGISSDGGIFMVTNSCIAGSIIFAGIGSVTGTSGGTIISTDALLNKENITKTMMTYDGTW